MDGGYSTPAVAQAITTIAETREDCYVYLSTAFEAEESANYMAAIVQYRNDLMLNSSYASLFAGWVKVYDPYNQTEVWCSPVGFAAAAQAFTAEQYDMWYPAAGWNRGGFKALDVRRRFKPGERDYLVDNQICPIRYKQGSGLVIWGNDTLLTIPGPFQSRHVRMLVIVIKGGVSAYLEGKFFDLNSARGRQMIVEALTQYMADEIGDGVVRFLVVS